MKNSILSICLLAIAPSALGQNVGIGSTSFTPNASAVLELRSTTSGFLLPKMTAAQMAAISSPAEGVIVYQTNLTKGFKYFNGADWVEFGGGADNFGSHIAEENIQLDGHWLSNDGGNEGIRIDNSGKVGIGTDAPDRVLHLQVSENSGLSFPLLIRNTLANSGGTGSGIGFNNANNGNYVKNALYFERTSDFGRGKFHILMNNSNNSDAATLSDSKMTILSDGKMGVGTTAPLTRMHLYGNGTSGFSLGGTSSVPNPAEGPEIGFGRGGLYNGPGAAIQMIDYDGYSGGLAFLVKRGVANGAGGSFSDNFPSDVLQALTIVNTGNIGVGTSDPVAKLQIADGNMRLSNSGGSAGQLQFQGTSSGATSFRAGAQGATNISYTLPTAAPVANGAVLASTTAGVMSWDSFLKPTTVFATANTTVNPASYNAGTVSGMSIASVPAGTYLVTFNADITRSGSTACQCVVRAGGSDVTATERSFEIPAATSVFSLMGRVTLASTGTIEIRCRKTSGGAGFTVGKRSLSLQSSN